MHLTVSKEEKDKLLCVKDNPDVSVNMLFSLCLSLIVFLTNSHKLLTNVGADAGP